MESGAMKKMKILIIGILVFMAVNGSQAAFAQDSLYSSCGVLLEGENCLVYIPEGNPFQAALEFYGSYGAGDSVFVSGIILYSCDTLCSDVSVCIINNSIGPCQGGEPQYPFDDLGVLVQLGDCLLFTPFSSPSDYLFLENYASYQEGDTVYVSGSLFPSCQTECTFATGCIVNNTITDTPPPPPNYPFESYGILFQGLDCVLFAPHGDTAGGFVLDNYGMYGPGDTVQVAGDLNTNCQTACTGAWGCIENNTIDTIWMPSTPIAGSAILKLQYGYAVGDILEMMNATVVDSIIQHNIFLLQFEDSIPLSSFMVDLLGFQEVIYAEPNLQLNFPENLQLSISFPDEYAPPLDMEADQPANFFQQSCLEMLDVDSAGQMSSGSGSVVAVIDNGVEADHPFIDYANLLPGYDFYDDDTDPSPDTGIGCSHGTFVSGLIELIAPDCQIMPLKALNGEGTGNSFAIAKAIYYAIDNGADIINMSFGTYQDSYLLRNTCEEAIDSGLILVAAGGNDSTTAPIFPAAYPHVISVTAVDTLDYLADFSNYGAAIDICAPGVNLYSSLYGEYDWGTWTGTSFSAPLASAVCALMHSLKPNITPIEAETHLRMSAERDLGPGLIVPPDFYYGYGRLDAANAVWTLNINPIDDCGDVNHDYAVNISDAVSIINFVFLTGTPPPEPINIADVNYDGEVNVSDAVYLINYIYLGGPEPNCGNN